MSGRRQTDLCKKGKKATVNDPMHRSVNRNATAGSPEDICALPSLPRSYSHAYTLAPRLLASGSCESAMPVHISGWLCQKTNSSMDLWKQDRHNPWRAPGNAPIGDVCGFAGGTPWGPNALEAGDYINTTYAHHGTRGSTLPKMPTGTVWKIGGTAEVCVCVPTVRCVQAHARGSRSPETIAAQVLERQKQPRWWLQLPALPWHGASH